MVLSSSTSFIENESSELRREPLESLEDLNQSRDHTKSMGGKNYNLDPKEVRMPLLVSVCWTLSIVNSG